MSKLLLLPILALLAILVSAPITGAQSVSTPDTEDRGGESQRDVGVTGEVPDPTEGVQSSKEALAQDMALIAKATGWTIEEAEINHAAAEAVGTIAIRIADEKPEIFVGSVVSQDPYEAPSIYIKGPVDDFVSGLVAESEVEVRIVDNQPYSFDELEERKLSVQHALEDKGFEEVSAGFDITAEGEIEATVTRQAGLPDKATDILSALPASLRDSIDLTVIDSPVFEEFSAFGGMWVRDNGANICTSGWSVWNGSGTTGVTTAGHCGNGVDQINDPGAGLTSLTYQSGHQGQWGDVEWLTSGQLEPARFYASSSDIRYVTEVEPRAGISQGEYICIYGRASNSRDCTTQVEIVSKSCGGLDRLVQMDDLAGTYGDSGGGWSFGNKAYGSDVGACNSKAIFSVADLYDEALGITVRVAQKLPTNGVLTAGDYLESADGRFTAIMQTDGNFVLYQNGVGALWASSSCGQSVFGSNMLGVMQSDGNFVMYFQGSSTARWATSWSQNQQNCPSSQQTSFGSGHVLIMQNDGNLVMYGSGGAKWASGTCCH